MSPLNPNKRPQRTKLARHSGLRQHRTAAQADHGIRSHDVMKVLVVATKFLNRGTVVLASLDFAGAVGHKPRPCIVVSKGAGQVTVIPCSSVVGKMYAGDIALCDLAAAGLSRWTKARTAAIARIPAYACIEVLGYLGEEDAARVLGESDAA